MKDYKLNKVKLDNGETMAYRKTGSSDKVLILIHGNQSSSVFFQRTMEHFEDGFTVYAIDLIGFGDSSYNRRIESIADFAKDVDLFMDKMNIEKATVLGWSTGGGVAMELAALYPNRVKSIILLDSVGIKGYYMYKYDENLIPILNKRIYKREDILRDPVSVKPVLAAFKNLNRQFIKYVWNMSIFNLNKPADDEYNIYLDGIMKQRNLVDTLTALANFNITNEYNGVKKGSGHIDMIRCPVYIIHGEKDLVVNVDLARKAKEAFGDRAKIFIIKNAGHAAMFDKEKDYFSILSDILK